MAIPNYRTRWISKILEPATKSFKVVVLTGARQTGKTTFLQNEPIFSGWHYLTLDDYNVLEQSQNDPQSLWYSHDKVIIDEAQKSPGILSAIKLEVDRHPGKRFVLSGSANLLLMRSVSESLAGRAVYFKLNPMSLGEIHRDKYVNTVETLFSVKLPQKGRVKRKTQVTDYLLNGFVPPLINSEKVTGGVTNWWNGYVSTYLERDLRALSQVDSLVDFRRLMQILALRTGTVLNRANVARDAGLSRPTTTRYINLLEVSNIIELIPGYYNNRSKRVVKSPKLYWFDPGIGVFLSGIYDENELKDSKEYGAFFESMVYHHLRIYTELLTPPGKLFFWRTEYGDEVDFVIQHGTKLLAVKVKLTKQVGYNDTQGLRQFMRIFPETVVGVLVYTGEKVVQLDDKIIAVPWDLL
ncbi:MAG: ATP-binding protein [Elusimicrobiota bacterium]